MAEIIKIEDNCDEAVQKAKEYFFDGKVFIYPTDTIYGLGANPFNDEAMKRISTIKNRDDKKNYILLISSMEQLLKYTEIENERLLDLLNEMWPNPVSVVLKLNAKTRADFNKENIAFRIPSNRFCIKVLEAIKMPLVTTSVNKTGQASYVDPSQIIDNYSEEVDAIFYSIKQIQNRASTLIDMTSSEPVVLRQGKFQIDSLIKKFSLNSLQ